MRLPSSSPGRGLPIWARVRASRSALFLGMMLALPAAAAPGAMPAGTSAAAPSVGLGGLQVLLGLVVVLAIMMGAVWLLKRFAPMHRLGSAPVRVVGGVNVGGRERIMVVEVADQWIVVGVAPGRVNTLSTLPRQETPAGALAAASQPGGAESARSFSGWLKHSLERRQGR